MYHKLVITENVFLSRITENDAQSIAQHINDQDIYNNTLKVPYPYSERDAQNFIRHVADFEKEHQIQKDWAIRIRGEMVGGIGLLYNFGINSHRSEIGYWLSKTWRGKGIMQQVIRIFTDFCFSSYHLKRLEAHVFTHNSASKQVLIKTGFEKEGLIKAAFIKDGKFKDAYLFSRLAPDFT